MTQCNNAPRPVTLEFKPVVSSILNKSETQTEKSEKAEKRESVVIKKYANRRLYNTETSTYVTLDDLAEMVRFDKDFVVYDAKSGDDLTHTVLTQIIVDQESRPGQTLLPIPFLRQLIRFYDDSIARMVPGYLQFSMETLVKEQEKMRAQFANAFSSPTAAFEAYQEQVRKNMAMFEAMWNPFALTGLNNSKKDQGAAAPQPAVAAVPPKKPQIEAVPSPRERDELGELKAQLAAMQQRIEKLSQSRE